MIRHYRIKVYAPEKNEYAIQRYEFEAWRHWRIIDRRLEDRMWMMGDQYSLLDMAVRGWGKSATTALGDDAWSQLPNLKRLLDVIDARPAAHRALALKERYQFKSEMDDQSWRAMFPHMRPPPI